IKQRAHIPGIIQAQPVIDQVTRIIMPFINLTAYARTPGQAAMLVNAAADSMNAYVNQQQDLANTPKVIRVSLPQLNRAAGATLSAGRRKTTPIVIFLTVMIAAIGLAFLLENLRPRVHIVGRD